jgi:hypothetical protein
MEMIWAMQVDETTYFKEHRSLIVPDLQCLSTIQRHVKCTQCRSFIPFLKFQSNDFCKHASKCGSVAVCNEAPFQGNRRGRKTGKTSLEKTFKKPKKDSVTGRKATATTTPATTRTKHVKQIQKSTSSRRRDSDNIRDDEEDWTNPLEDDTPVDDLFFDGFSDQEEEEEERNNGGGGDNGDGDDDMEEGATVRDGRR